MGHKLAIDFGTTNSMLARWDEKKEGPAILTIDGLSATMRAGLPPSIPSLVYVNDGRTRAITCGQAVQSNGFDVLPGNRLFRNFKRGIVATPSPEPREIDGAFWADRDAGQAFLKQLVDALPYRDEDIDQLVLAAPVASFEGYLSWLNDVVTGIAPEKIRVVDESTAAALGYTVTEPGAVVLVLDFGGGTLDLSLVQLPERREKTGGILKHLLGGRTSQYTAEVIAKAGRIIGGSDVDQWLLAEVVNRTGLTPPELGQVYAKLLTLCEKAKIELSTLEQTIFSFAVNGKTHAITITRKQLETLLEENGFYIALRRVVDKVMHVARQRGIFKEDIRYVLLVGGTSLMPSVQTTLKQYFTETAVRTDKPFTAVAEGALQVAAGYGLDDYLIHSYGLRYLNEESRHEYDEIIPMGSRYPISHPVEVVMEAAHKNQQEMEFVIGEIDTEAVAMIEVKYENGQAVFVAQAADDAQRIVPLNLNESVAAILAKLDPPGQPGTNRVHAWFVVDDRRRLRITAVDLLTGNTLLDDVVVATLR